MPDIRPLEPADLPGVAPLVRNILPQWMADDRIPGFIAGTMLEDPWADPELPPLVAIGDEGEVIGFIGSQVRRFRLGDRELRGVCPSHLIVDQEKAGAAGALLLRRLLAAGQDFTFSDTASDLVARMWRTFGGHLDSARACDWMIVLRPGRWLRGIGAAAIRRDLGREQVPVGALPLQAAGRRIMRRAFPDPDPEVSGASATSGEIVEALPLATRGLRFRPDYDQAFLDHLFGQIDAVLGTVVRRVVRRNDAPIGWYAYRAEPSGIGRVLHLAAAANEADAVLGEALEHARANRVAVLSGRTEPHLVPALRRRLAVLGFARQPVIHAHEPELLAMLSSELSLLTRLDSEWFAA